MESSLSNRTMDNTYWFSVFSEMCNVLEANSDYIKGSGESASKNQWRRALRRKATNCELATDYQPQSKCARFENSENERNLVEISSPEVAAEEMQTASKAPPSVPSGETEGPDAKDVASSSEDPAQPALNHERRFPLQSSDSRIMHDIFIALMNEEKVEEATDLLKSRTETELQQMRSSEGCFQVDDDVKIKKVINNMKAFMTETNRMTADDVSMIAGDSHNNSSYVHVLILYACAGNLYLLESDPNERVRGIMECARGCRDVITSIADKDKLQNDLTYNVGMEIMNGFIDDVTKAENCSPDVKTEMLAWCLEHTSYCQHAFENYERTYCERGIDIMRNHFGPDASKYEVFCCLLRDMVVSQHRTGNHFEAKASCVQATKACESAEDMSEYDKRMFLAEMKVKLFLIC